MSICGGELHYVVNCFCVNDFFSTFLAIAFFFFAELLSYCFHYNINTLEIIFNTLEQIKEDH